MKVVFSALARTRLLDIETYIADQDPRAAERVVHRIIFAAELLGEHPKLGVVWKGGTTSALVVPTVPYRIHYRIEGKELQVITVAHTSQLPPKL